MRADGNFALVPNRTCGECTVCCTALTINQPDLQKLPGITCPNCVEKGGCSIYNDRPGVCRSWFCGWREFEFLDESWRPDRKGILVTKSKADGYDLALKFTPLAAPRLLFEQETLRTIAVAVSAGVGVYISAPGKVGMTSGKAFINLAVASAVQARNLEAMRTAVKSAYRGAKAVPQRPVILGR